MTWLTPSVIATLAGTTILTLTYFYLYIQDKKSYIKTWTLAWAVYCFRYIFMLIMISGEEKASFLILNQTAALINGMLLLIGAYQFINKKIPSYLTLIFTCGAAWIFTSVFLNFSFLLTSLPTFYLLTVINIWIGVLFLKSSSSQKLERTIVGCIFILWGLHKANYPFLRPVEWFAPWGYLLGAAFEMLAALGLLMVYFKKTRDDLTDSEQQLKGIYGTADNIAFISTELKGGKTSIIDINPGAELIFNCTREEVINQNPLDFHPEENKEKILMMQDQLIESKNGYSKQTTLVRKNGEIFPALYTVRPRLDAKDNVLGTLEVTIDLSHKQLVEDEIRLQSQIISRMSEGVYLVRRDGVIVYANPKFEEMFGYDFGEMIGQSATIIQNDPKTIGRILKYFKTHSSWQGEIENVKKDGTVFWTYASVINFNHSQHGEVYIAVHLDISEQKKAQKEKQELEAQLRQSHKMEAVGTLSGGIAHEFNNILGIILGNAELAMDDMPDKIPTHKFLDEIKNATLRGKNIVQQLLSFSRKDSPKKLALGIKETIIETIHFLEASIPSTIEFKKMIDPDCYPVMGNKTQIHQVLINLCNNAAQSMEESGGTLSLSIQNKHLENELISKDTSIPPGNYVCLTVSDTGHGIPEDIVDHVFDPFYTTKAVDKGSGMGLAVVHGIMKAHNGIIRILSQVHQGTTCECYFPAILLPPSDTGSDANEELIRGTETILFVDDETALVQIGQRMLERLGYKVFIHTNPLTALDFFQSSYQKIDLVITDMTMPQMTGDHLIKKLLDINPEIKTIISTGYSSKIDEKAAERIGSGGFIMKPMKLSTLSRIVRDTLDN